MSPEQARGDVVDKRADIWAFGCVCFEMLTGQPAFRGKPTEATRDGLRPRWDLIPAAVPPGVTALLKRCLDEDPSDAGATSAMCWSISTTRCASQSRREAASRRGSRAPVTLGLAAVWRRVFDGWAVRGREPSV